MWAVVACGHRCGVVEAVEHRLFEEERRSRVWAEHRASWALVNVAKTNCDLARSDKRSVGSPGAAVVRHSRVGRVEDQTNMRLVGLLLEQPMLEMVALGRHTLVLCLDEEPVTLSQDVAEARLECEALGGASSCQPWRHGLPHLVKHLVDHIQNELGTDLQLGWADIAADAPAGHRAHHG